MASSPVTAPGVLPLTRGRVSVDRTWWNLLEFLVRARMRLWIQDRVLGFWWWLLEPMAMTATYFLMMKVFLGAKREHYPLFIMCAMLPWVWFSTAGSLAIHCLVRNARLIKSFRVSYVVFPSAEVLATTIRFMASLAILALLIAYFRVIPTWHLVWLPLVIGVQLLFTLGVAYWLALAQVYLEDSTNIWQVTTRIWFFLSPSIYPLEKVPEPLRLWFSLNPFAALFSSYRCIVMEGRSPLFGYLAVTAVLGAALMLSGALVLRRLRGTLPLHL